MRCVGGLIYSAMPVCKVPGERWLDGFLEGTDLSRERQKSRLRSITGNGIMAELTIESPCRDDETNANEHWYIIHPYEKLNTPFGHRFARNDTKHDAKMSCAGLVWGRGVWRIPPRLVEDRRQGGLAPWTSDSRYRWYCTYRFGVVVEQRVWRDTVFDREQGSPKMYAQG